MALDILKTADVIESFENFLDKHRPPEHLREKIDIDYKIDNQSVIIFEVRPHWKDTGKVTESPIVKTTWVKTQQVWKIFWMRSDLKWHQYEPVPRVKTLTEFIQVVDDDKYGCFWG